MSTLVPFGLVVMLAAADAEVKADARIQVPRCQRRAAPPGRKGDLAILDRIVAVGSSRRLARRVIDGTNLNVAPGLSICTRTATMPWLGGRNTGQPFIPDAGVTTVVTGNCGFGPADVGTYFKKMEDPGVGTNVIHLVPHNSVRRKVLKNANRAPTADELKQMEAIVDQGMRDGAWGLATGLIYNPGTYAKTDEIVALARVAAKHGGFYASHIRGEGPGVLAAAEEALRSVMRPVSPCNIRTWRHPAARHGSHGGRDALVEAARKKADGHRDQYPYEAQHVAAAMVVPVEREERPRISGPAEDTSSAPRLAVASRTTALLGRGARSRSPVQAEAEWQGSDLLPSPRRRGRRC